MAATLTPRQERFVHEYIRDLHATRAYKAAGYRVKSDDVARANASRLLAQANISAAIAAARAARAKKLEITADWVVRGLVRNVKRASTAVPVLDREGNETGEYQYQGSVVNRGLELIGKHLGMFQDAPKPPDERPLQIAIIEVVRPARELSPVTVDAVSDDAHAERNGVADMEIVRP